MENDGQTVCYKSTVKTMTVSVYKDLFRNSKYSWLGEGKSHENWRVEAKGGLGEG